MRIKYLALILSSVVASAAYAAPSVVIGGKFDAGYQFKSTANPDAVCGTSGDCGGKTTETLGDGSASTSRITVKAQEDLMPGWSAVVDLDLRFGTIEEGKNFSQDTSNKLTSTGGLNSNDKKALTLNSPFGSVAWGVQNVGDNFYLAEKPYMISPKDLEIVKYGIATYRFTALTSRETEIRTKPINVGPVGLLFKAGYAFGDQRKSGSSNVAGNNSGDVRSAGFEWKFGNLVNGGVDYLNRTPTTVASTDSFRLLKVYTSVKPVTGLKIALAYINQNGYGTLNSKKAGFQDKITNLSVSYNLNDKFEFGGSLSKVRDVGEQRNSGKGWMIGGAYFLSKSTYVYAARQKSDWESNQKGVYGGKYDGTGVNFAGSADKLDMTYTRLGIVKEF